MVAALAEYMFLHHADDSFFCFFAGLRNNDTFSECQAICLDNSRDRCRLKIGKRRSHIIKDLVCSSRDTVFFHQVLGKDLAAFNDGRICTGSETRNTNRFQGINTA